jgi:hypothetical protein
VAFPRLCYIRRLRPALAQAKTGARFKENKDVPEEMKFNTKPPPENHFKRQRRSAA